MYNLRTPAMEEPRLIVSSGEEMEIELIGDLDIVCHCQEDIAITLRDVAYIPRLSVELIYFNVIQEFNTITLDRNGAHMLNGRVTFTKSKSG